MALFNIFSRSTSKEIDILRHDVAIFKNLIKERQHPLDLVRELLSNAGAIQVGANRIEVTYTKDKEGHVFGVSDDGCGMDFSIDEEQVGRLNRFLGLGLSSIVGEKSDEFSWKGLGSKLAYQSRRVVIETRAHGHPLYEVRIDEPWASLNRNVIPRPRITEHGSSDHRCGTRIKVLGHPPHRQEEPFTMDEIARFLQHRTFAGFTRRRLTPPRIVLSVLGEIRELEFGFPEFRGIEFPPDLTLDSERRTLFVNLLLTEPAGMSVRLKGFITWDPARFDLADGNLNTGLILSSRGIPFFELPMADYGAHKILTGSPGKAKVCLVAECETIYSEMNLSRSGLVDCANTLRFREMLRELFRKLEASAEYAAFRQLKEQTRRAAQVAMITRDQRTIASEDQNWVVLERDGAGPTVLMREPQNETEVIAILWKLESLGALPFEKFQTIAHPNASRGPDLFVNFQEEQATQALSVAMFEAENHFYSYKPRRGLPSQYPRVICWDVPARGRKVRLQKTAKRYKFTVDAEEQQVPVYVMKLMDGLRVMSTRDLRERGIDI